MVEAEEAVGVVMSAIKKYPGPCTAAARANIVSSLQTVADVAADKGVTLGLEAVNRSQTNVMNTARDAMALLADIDRPNVKVHLDTYHMNIEEASMASAVRTCGDKLGCAAKAGDEDETDMCFVHVLFETLSGQWRGIIVIKRIST